MGLNATDSNDRARRLNLSPAVATTSISLGRREDETMLYTGWGTHYAYVSVGNPGQLVSVILDTGSHYTACVAQRPGDASVWLFLA